MDVWAREVREVGEGMADRGHLPVQDADDAVLSLVEDHVVDLVVAVDKSGAVAGLGGFVGKKADHVAEMRNVADGNPSVDVDSLGLGLRDNRESAYLTVVEPSGSSEVFHPE